MAVVFKNFSPHTDCYKQISDDTQMYCGNKNYREKMAARIDLHENVVRHNLVTIVTRHHTLYIGPILTN